jgi:hypothetical protein
LLALMGRFVKNGWVLGHIVMRNEFVVWGLVCGAYPIKVSVLLLPRPFLFHHTPLEKEPS